MSEVKPALTPEEWIAVYDEGVDLGSGYVICGYEDGLSIFEWSERVGVSGERQCRAVAAVALRGQPCGFTHEMLEDVRNAAEDYRTHRREGMARAMDAVADQIASLLPPRRNPCR